MTAEYSGSCLCGNVQFRIQGEFEGFYLCHCAYCRKDTGSAHAANLFFHGANIDWQSGADKITVHRLPSTEHVKSFCAVCGAAVPSVQMDGRLLVVPAGSLDTKVDKKPNAHIFMSSKANWDEGLENIPMYEGMPIPV
jgi:hypothetical protein